MEGGVNALSLVIIVRDIHYEKSQPCITRTSTKAAVLLHITYLLGGLTFLNPAIPSRSPKCPPPRITTFPDTSPLWGCYFIVQVNSTYVYLFSWTTQTVRISISSFFPCRIRIILSQSALLEKMVGKIQSSLVCNWILALDFVCRIRIVLSQSAPWPGLC
jgi:hypothetical protein